MNTNTHPTLIIIQDRDQLNKNHVRTTCDHTAGHLMSYECRTRNIHFESRKIKKKQHKQAKIKFLYRICDFGLLFLEVFKSLF